MINGNIYTIALDDFVNQVLLRHLRRPKILDWLYGLIAPLISHYTLFTAFKNEAIYKTEHNASVTLLQKVLNDHFDIIPRRIFINNADVVPTEHYYNPGEGDPFYFYDDPNGPPEYFLDPEAYNTYGGDFTVFLPNAIKPGVFAEEQILVIQIREKLDYYKLFGTKYTLVWIDL